MGDDLPDNDSQVSSDELTGALKEAVERIRAVAPPAESMKRVLLEMERRGSSEKSGSILRFAHVIPLAVAASLAVLLGLMLANRLSREADQAASVPPLESAGAGDAGKQAPVKSGEGPNMETPKPIPRENPKESPLMLANKNGVTPAFGGVASASRAGVSPSRSLAVAAEATVIVSTGGNKPIRLGAKLPWDRNNVLHVWDWSKSDESRPLAVSTERSFAVSPDGKWIVTGDGRLIDAATSAVKQLPNCAGHVLGLQFSPDGASLVLVIRPGEGYPPPGEGGSARVLDLPSGNKRFEIPDVWPFTFACAFTPGSAQLLLMDKDRFIRRWDARTGKELGRYQPAFMNSIRAIVVSPDGERLAGAGTRGDIYLWELASGKYLHTLIAGHEPGTDSLEAVSTLAFSPDGKMLAGKTVFNVVLWHTDSGKLARSLPREFGGVVQIRFSKDGKKVTSIHGFHGYRNPNNAGEELLVYPEVKERGLD
jgi:hypothetical protein